MKQYVYSKAELSITLKEWGVEEPIPGKGQKLIVCFPKGSPFDMATITRMEKGDGPYRRPMYKMEIDN